MGVFSTSAHPCSQAFALPPVKDKQRSQPTPSVILYIGSRVLYIAHWRREYNSPFNAGAYRCITSVTGSKLRSLRAQNSNVRKRLPRPALQTAWWSHSIDVLTRPASGEAGFVGCKITTLSRTVQTFPQKNFRRMDG